MQLAQIYNKRIITDEVGLNERKYDIVVANANAIDQAPQTQD